MAEWYEKLYVGARAAGKVKKVKRQVERGRFLPELYLITLSSCESDQLDILHSCYLLQKHVREHLPCIVGIAFGYEEALEVVQSIVTQAYRDTGDCRLREYLQSRLS